MARSKTGLWWNIARNMGYHLALRNFGNIGFDPETVGNHRPQIRLAQQSVHEKSAPLPIRGNSVDAMRCPPRSVRARQSW
jgi:hypothetical protein